MARHEHLLHRRAGLRDEDLRGDHGHVSRLRRAAYLVLSPSASTNRRRRGRSNARNWRGSQALRRGYCCATPPYRPAGYGGGRARLKMKPDNDLVRVASACSVLGRDSPGLGGEDVTRARPRMPRPRGLWISPGPAPTDADPAGQEPRATRAPGRGVDRAGPGQSPAFPVLDGKGGDLLGLVVLAVYRWCCRWPGLPATEGGHRRRASTMGSAWSSWARSSSPARSPRPHPHRPSASSTSPGPADQAADKCSVVFTGPPWWVTISSRTTSAPPPARHRADPPTEPPVDRRRSIRRPGEHTGHSLGIKVIAAAASNAGGALHGAVHAFAEIRAAVQHLHQRVRAGDARELRRRGRRGTRWR